MTDTVNSEKDITFGTDILPNGNGIYNLGKDDAKWNLYVNTINEVDASNFGNTDVTATTTGTGNAITSIEASGDTITATKGATFLTSHQDISGKADKANITAGTAGTSSATSGSTLAVPYVTMNAQGIVTGYGTHTHTVNGFLTSSSTLDATKLSGTIPSSCYTNTIYTHPSITATANTSTASPAHGGTFTAIDSVTVNSNGHVTAYNTKTVTLPSDSDTKNTAGSTDTSSKIYLVGATSQAANPQTYSDNEVYATNGVLSCGNLVATTVLATNQTGGTTGGLSLYGGTGNVTNYGIAFRTTGNGTTHGYVTGDWATYNYMTGAATRGWVWKAAGTNVASIGGTGSMALNGALSIGCSGTTKPCTLQYDSTNVCLNFVFA